MKKHFRTFLLFLTVFVFSSALEEKNNRLIGEWVYEVTDAPYGYEKGSLIFSEKDGQTTCVIKLEAGELSVSNLNIEKDSVTFTSYIEGSQINVKLIIEKDKLIGKVDSPEGPKTLSAIKKQR